MIVYYHPQYNINLGVFNSLHPFDGTKFEKVYSKINCLKNIDIRQPASPASKSMIDNYADSLLQLLLVKKRYILRALEVPYIPLLPFSFIDKRILLPMRWGVAGTIDCTKVAIAGNHCWNLSGGYHHASRAASEGFCIYNDIGIAVNELTANGILEQSTKVLIIDIDAHHGNGNADTFMENSNVTILDIYNDDIYPQNNFTKARVNTNIPIHGGETGDSYLEKLSAGLDKLTPDYSLAYVIAGTDVLINDPLGGLKLSIEQCIERDTLVFGKLQSLSIPAVFLGGGGYSKDSEKAISGSLQQLYTR